MGICCFSKPPLAFSGSQTGFEFTEVFLGRLFAIHNRMRIVGANDAICVDLDGFGGEVWFVGVLRRKIPEFEIVNFQEDSATISLDETTIHTFPIAGKSIAWKLIAELGVSFLKNILQSEKWHNLCSFAR